MEKLKELEAALSGNNLEAIWLASAAWAAQREGTASTSSHEGTLTLKSLDRLLSLAVGCCKDIDPKNCYIMSLAVMHMAPLAAQKSNKEELKLVKQGLRGCLRFLLENFLLKEAKLAPGDEIQLCISLQNFCVGFEKVVEICHCSDAATVADCLFPSGDGLAVCEAIHRAVLQPLPQREAVEDADQKKLQDLCHFCRWKVSRAVTQLLCHALNAASKLGWQGGTARLCKEETCKALWHEARCGSDAARQQLCLELLWQITRRTKNCKAGETIQRPQFLVKFLEEVTCGKMIQNTAPKDFPARKAKMLNEVSECGGGILQGTCALRWGHLNQEKVKVMLTKHSFSLEFPGVAQVMEVPWACLLLPEFLMHKDRPSSAQWPLQVGIDPYAAMVLRAIPPEIAKSIDQQQVMTLEVDEDAMSFIGKLHDLLHGNDVHQNALTAPGKTSSSSKADVKKTAAKAQPKVPPTRRVTRSMTRSQSLAAPLTSAPAPPVRSASEPIHRPEGPPKKVQEFPSSTVAPQAVAPPDGNKKKGLWEKASDIARSAKAMLGATVATPARAVSSAAVPTPTLKRCRSASPGRRSSTDPNSLSSEACPSGLNSAPPAGPFATRRARSADPTPTTRAVPAVKRSRSEGRHVKKTSTDATTTSSTTQLHVKNPLTPAAAPPTPSANQPPVKNPLTPAAAPTESANQPLVKNPLTPAAAPTPSANQPLAKNPLTPAAAPPTPSANHPPVKNPLTPAVAPPTPFAIIPSAPRRRSRSRQPQDCTPTSLPATPSTANPRARSRSRQPGQESTPTSLPATPGMAQSNPRARSRSRQTGRDTPFTPPTAPPPSPPMAPMPHPMPPRTRSRSEPPREAEVPSPGGVSLASRTSRVSLGEAAGLANEAANLGIMGPDRLRQMCSDQGLPREGLRTELISRLLIHRLTSAPRTVNEFSPLSPSFAPFSGPNQSELRAACVQRGLSDIGSSYDLLQRLQVSRNSQGADSTAALKARSGLAAARKVALEGTGAAQSTETPRKRLRCKSPASALYGRPQEPAVTPPKRLRCKSPASARPDLKEGLSAVCGAAVQSLLTLRPEQLEAECQRQGLSPRRSPHAMAYRLATARLQNLGSPSSADSAARTEIVSPGSILKRGKFGKSPPARTRSASKPPTPTSARGASQRRSATPNPRQSPRSTPNPRGAGRSQSRTVKSPGSGKRATSEPKTPPRTRSASKLRTPTSARGASQRRSATPNPRQTPRSRTPNTRGKSPAASLLCGAPGVAASPEKTLPSTPQRRSQPRSNVPTGDKVRRQSKPSGKVAHEKPRTPTPRRSPKSPTMTRRELCHATKRGGLPCNFPGSKRPTGALFFYCGYHAEKWRAHERR